MGKDRKVYRVLVGKPEGKRSLGRPKRRRENGIRMDLREVGWAGVELIQLCQNRWRAVVNMVINRRVLAPGVSYLVYRPIYSKNAQSTNTGKIIIWNPTRK
jgi:hypothetical protein